MQWVLLALGMIGGAMCSTQLMAQAPYATAVGPQPLEKPLLRIGLIADAQYSDDDADKNRFYRISLEKIHQAVDTFNSRNVDLVINLGDLIDQRMQSYVPVLREVDRLKMPVLHILGNHEFWDVPYHAQTSVLDSLGLTQGYCDYLVPGWRLLLLDGTELAEYALGAHQDLRLEAEMCHNSLLGHENAAIWNGAIGRAQLAWIDWQLAEADAAGEHVLLFCHFPISPAGHPMTLWNEADLRALLAQHQSPTAWIAGHAHEGAYSKVNNLHHLTLEGMLMTPDSNAFAVLDLYPDHLIVQGYGREPYRVLALPGSHVPESHCLPQAGFEEDAKPPSMIFCRERTVTNWLGETVFSEEIDDRGISYSPKLQPGCYGILEHGNDGFQFGHLIVLPK